MTDMTSSLPEPDASLTLSVIVPVFNQHQSIAENVRVIDAAVRPALGDAFEIIVVSDGSVDGTEERVLEHELPNVSVLHYDRNLGKGYAVKVGALEARGKWVGYIDADLDLHPDSLPAYVRAAEEEGLDFAIGSKRHADSHVHYPRARRIASALFQGYVWLLLRIGVRDTQVGIKVFRSDVAQQVFPFLIIKRYAFDIELLAVSREFGFRRMKEFPITLDYKFTGSGVRPREVLYALLDTLGVAYRLRILKYYQRRRRIAGPFGWTRPRAGGELDVTVVCSDASRMTHLRQASPAMQVVTIDPADPDARRRAAADATTDLVAFVEAGAVPSGNWLSATIPFLVRRDIGAVVTSTVAPATGTNRQRAAAGIAESRVGGGSLYFRFTPGNIRFVSDFPARSYILRRQAFLDLPERIEADMVPAELARQGWRILYTPEAFVVLRPEPLFKPHLRRVAHYARLRARSVRSSGLGAIRPSTLIGLVVGGVMLAGLIAFAVGVRSTFVDVWAVVVAAYLASVAVTGILAANRYRSAVVGALVVAGTLLTHVAYGATFIRRLLAEGSGA